MKSWTGFILVLLLAGCPKDDPKPTASSASAASSATTSASGPKTATAPPIERDWCKDFIAALEVCAKSPPAGSSAEAYTKQVEAQRNAYDKAGAVEKSQMQSGCQTGLMTLKQQKPGCGAAK